MNICQHYKTFIDVIHAITLFHVWGGIMAREWPAEASLVLITAVIIDPATKRGAYGNIDDILWFIFKAVIRTYTFSSGVDNYEENFS